MAKIKTREDNVYTGAELDVLYKRYRAQYKDKEKYMRRKGIIMWDKLYTKEEFQAMYAAAANDTRKRYASEKAKSERIIDYLVDRQATELSHAQARAFQKAFKEREGRDISLREVYKDAPGLISEMNTKLKEEGYSGKERASIISAAFFGSPE